MAEFGAACADRGIALLSLPPRSPKLNGCVERANRTHTEGSTRSPTSYNSVRPHQALGCRTPHRGCGRWHFVAVIVSPSAVAKLPAVGPAVSAVLDSPSLSEPL